MGYKPLSAMDKAHIALDILDNLEIKCQQNIEGAVDDVKNIKIKMDELLTGRAFIDLDDDEREDYWGFLTEIDCAQFTADFYKEILDAAVKRFRKIF